ncbi:universal stress protein [Haloarchaeobius sp. HME9146]|uniref:universal stress protein n=1 Tax=Haloarchaeobius sp. HME9146 TaxID=2978732 RepID=UPI0021C0AE17|nr:universal stress protein [Haloarchaeobius sp. HME9146]MCT9096789.1 universal stress protein [Haloarchaeobius sp. HME9146]
MYDRILVPTDGSQGVERAIRHAVDLAAAHGSTLHAVYVLNSASYGGVPIETSWEGLHDMLQQEGEHAIERVRAIAEPEAVPVVGTILEGSPSKEVVRYAEENDCDLVVMGTHGRGGIDRLLLGSVAERVVRSSAVPVLTVQVGEQE